MKLSEAIRLGAMQVGPTTGTKHAVFQYGGRGDICGACALGAVGIAIGVLKSWKVF